MSREIIVCGVRAGDLTAPRCPVCGRPGRGVRPETVENLVLEEELPAHCEGYSLCLDPGCEVIYFGAAGVFFKKDVRVKVWFKEKDHDVPVCYCKGVTGREIIDHLARGCCRDMKDIQRHTGANTGKDCLVKNPAGT